MRKHHPKNERIKRRYLTYLEEAKHMSSKSTDQVAAALTAFEQSTNYKDFASFHIEQARSFKRQLNDQINPKTGRTLAKATIRSRLLHLKGFFHWLAGQPGYKSRVSYSDCEYFNPSGNDTRIATAQREQRVPSEAQIRHVLDHMNSETDIEKRNRALIAFTFLTGMRDDAIASLSIQNVDLAARSVFQDARHVRTKNRKTMKTDFFPVGDDVEGVVASWMDFLTTERLFGPDDPLFPSTEVAVGKDGLFAAIGLSRTHWSNASAIRKIFRQAFEEASLPYFNPHSFQKTLAQLGSELADHVKSSRRSPRIWGMSTHEPVSRATGGSSPRYNEILPELRDKDVGDPDGKPDTEMINRLLKHLQNDLVR